MKSPGVSSHLTAHVLLAFTFPLSAQTQPSNTVLQPRLVGSLPLPLVSWQVVSIIAAPAVNCEAQVIVRGVDRRAETALAKGTSVEPR